MSKATALPIVDLTPFVMSASSDEQLARAKHLVEACRDVGFVFIQGHGVPKETIQQAFEISKKFYDLPKEEKMKASHPPGWTVHRGYSWPGLEKVSNATSSVDARDIAAQLREVQDFKVGS